MKAPLTTAFSLRQLLWAVAATALGLAWFLAGKQLWGLTPAAFYCSFIVASWAYLLVAPAVLRRQPRNGKSGLHLLLWLLPALGLVLVDVKQLPYPLGPLNPEFQYVGWAFLVVGLGLALALKGGWQAMACGVALGLATLSARPLPSLRFRATTSLDHVCKGHLEKVALALRLYHDLHGKFPPVAVQAADGTPLYSWRLLVLHEVGYPYLLNEFDLTQAWDSPRNLPVTERMARYFYCPVCDDPPGQTRVLAVTGPEQPWGQASPRGEPHIMLIEAGPPQPWTKPLSVSPAEIAKRFPAQRPGNLPGHLDTGAYWYQHSVYAATDQGTVVCLHPKNSAAAVEQTLTQAIDTKSTAGSDRSSAAPAGQWGSHWIYNRRKLIATLMYAILGALGIPLMLAWRPRQSKNLVAQTDSVHTVNKE